jgi:hypothetical protein
VLEVRSQVPLAALFGAESHFETRITKCLQRPVGDPFGPADERGSPIDDEDTHLSRLSSDQQRVKPKGLEQRSVQS